MLGFDVFISVRDDLKPNPSHFEIAWTFFTPKFI